MSVSVCLSVFVCVFVCPRSYLQNYTRPIFTISCACYPRPSLGRLIRSSSGGVAIRYVFPVLWMPSYLHISRGCSKSPSGCGSEAHTILAAWRVGIPVAGSGRSGLLLYSPEGNWAGGSAGGAESAVYDCLVYYTVV